MSSKCLPFLFSIICLSSFGQTTILTSKLIDSQTGKGIAQAHVVSHSTPLGSVSNSEGTFRLSVPAEYQTDYLMFHCLGYRTDSVRVSDMKGKTTIALVPEEYRLATAVVMPDSTLRVLLRNAYNRIAANYPQQASYYDAFYRETLQDPASGHYLYFVES